MNLLQYATSPYLLQHKDNPVQWREWGEAAFDEARSRDVPVFLSVGYAACHWCHVMAHESFEDDATAAYLNEHFVSVKVDREERPDVDAVYMEATQAMTGHGGWPMTVMMKPDGEPFFAGTYFPNEGRQGMPSFRQVLEAIVAAWRDRRDEVDKISADITRHLQRDQALPEAAIDDLGVNAVAVLQREFDEQFAGFGGAPKFPPSMVCEFLLRHHARTGSEPALRMAERTLEAMARGGIYDQLGGGFARYSVDNRWDVPHFEKMLYDNAQLLRVYLHWWRLRGGELARRVVVQTADFMLRELVTDQGGLASALDADSEGEEGTFYVWTLAELADILGDDDGKDAAHVFGMRPGGNFERGTSTLRRDHEPDDAERFELICARLMNARAHRIRPARDDKVIAGWNGLAIAALAEAGVLLDVPAYVDAARDAAALILDVHLVGRRLRRASRDGIAGESAGVLEDYAGVAEGLFTLYGVTGERRWYDAAVSLCERIREDFSDGHGGYFDTARGAEQLIKRPQDPTDNAYPSGQSLTLGVLTTLAALTGDAADRTAADALLSRLAGLGHAAPRFAGHQLAVAEAMADGPRQVAIVGGEDRQPLVRAAYLLNHPGVAIAQGEPGSEIPALLAQRGLVQGKAAAYVCHDFVCDLPVTDAAEIR